TLISLGAPSRLVEGAHRAALDEIAHARLACLFASTYRGAPVSPGPLSELRDVGAVTARSIDALARESLVDGCLNEGAAAAMALAASACAQDPAVRAAWARIARDESAHADLAWDIVDWCLANGEPGLGGQLRKLINTVRFSAGASPSPHLERDLETHGALSAE